MNPLGHRQAISEALKAFASIPPRETGPGYRAGRNIPLFAPNAVCRVLPAVSYSCVLYTECCMLRLNQTVSAGRLSEARGGISDFSLILSPFSCSPADVLGEIVRQGKVEFSYDEE